MEIAPGLPIIDIATPLATARVALQGAQVMAWRPNGMPPVLWLSDAAVFQPGKAVRGGIPVCWPWFGDRAGHSAHGFVRTRLWELRETSLDAADRVAGLRACTADRPGVHFTGETDRVYLDTTADCVIDDANQQRRITVAPVESHAPNMRVSVAGTGT